MNDQQASWLMFGLSVVGIFTIGFMVGTWFSIDFTTILPDQFGFDIPSQYVNDTIKIYLEDFNNAQYVCNQQ